jgi:hypothetical protein
MYFLDIANNKAGSNETLFSIDRDESTLRKWSLLRDTDDNDLLIKCIALLCCGQPYADQILQHCRLGGCGNLDALQSYCAAARWYTIASHSPYDSVQGSQIIKKLPTSLASPILSDNAGSPLHDTLIHEGDVISRIKTTDNARHFSLAIGSGLIHHQGTDDFDFNDPLFKLNRYKSLFDRGSPVTDPVALLEKIHYKAIRSGRYPAKQILQSLCSLFSEYLGIDTRKWQEKQHDFNDSWYALEEWQWRSALPALDIIRHLMDAFPKSGNPPRMHGVVILSIPDRHSDKTHFQRWITLMDRMFPNVQFIVTLADQDIAWFPDSIAASRIALPTITGLETPRAKRRSVRPNPNTILLIHLDGRLPNLALMKLSAYHKSLGFTVRLTRKPELLVDAEYVFASSIFYGDRSRRIVDRLINHYGESISVGGSGVDLQRRLPPEVDACAPDYDLYPMLGDRAIGFITRGCPYRCDFCLVPKKEGNVRQVSDLDDLLKGRNKLILLDDNLLALPQAEAILHEMAQRKLLVNFTQTLDIRLLDEHLVTLLKEIHWSNTTFSRRVIHFSLNGLSGLDRVVRNYRLFDFQTRDNVEFICMYDFDTTLEEDVERFAFIRSLPGAYVFVQQYQPTIDAPPRPNLFFFGADADRQIDKLVSIEYRQNMKSMEKYYRGWSRRYVEEYGTIHQRLIDTIFRYNNRDQKGLYVAKLLAQHGGKKRYA